ncbi:hypothetical protein [Yersinia mollaretii]|uniref:hypothetical protein n=1 Tax=Yersinia mollaretii TaxID=33060 RepID=UPI0005DE70EE|nr:hypothetical protein [Yersinia mollaretii]CQD37149.1 Serine rich protein [Yersinia mollaretii]CQH29438.1 Serine rich protein [Yersinia mollaretii]
MSMINTSSAVRFAAAPKVSSPSSRGSSSVASNLSGVSSSSENSPLSHTKSTSEENCHCFSQHSAGGKPLPMVDGDKHIAAFYDHLGQGESSVENMAGFSRMMNQGSGSCTVTSNIQDGTKAALALFSLLPAKENRDALKSQTKPFLKAMANLSENSNSINKQKTADKKLEKLNSALFKEFGLTHNADEKSNLDGFCSQYLNQYVYPDIIDKLSQSGLVNADQLKALQENPSQALSTLYPDLNGKNDEKIGVLKDGFLKHEGVNNKAVQLHLLIAALEHKTEIIAGIISNSLASDSPAASPIATRDLPDFPAREAAPDYNMASPATPNHGIQSPAISSVISPVFSPVFNNNFGELAPALNKIADVLERVISLENRLLPGDTSVGSARHVESIKVDIQTPEAPREMDPPTYAEVVEPLQSEKIQLKPTAPLMAAPMVQKTLTSGDDIDVASTRPPAAPQPEASPNIVLKKTTSSLNAQGTFFGAQGGGLPKYSDAAPVALTNGAISGSSQSTSYRNSDTNRVVDQPKMAPLADTKIEGSAQPDKMQAEPMAPLMTQSMAQKTLTSEDDIDGASTPTPAAIQAEAPAMTQAKKATYSLNAQGNLVGTKGALPSYREVPRVALTNGAISGSSQSTSYANSDTNGQLAEALKSREEQGATTAKSVNSAGTQFMGLNSAQNRTPINFIPKKMTTEYRLNESLNSKA